MLFTFYEPRTAPVADPKASCRLAPQCHWLNAYHARVRDVVGGELMTQDRSQGYEWLVAKTKPLPCVGGAYGDSRGKSSDTMAALTFGSRGRANGAGGVTGEAVLVMAALLVYGVLGHWASLSQ